MNVLEGLARLQTETLLVLSLGSILLAVEGIAELGSILQMRRQGRASLTKWGLITGTTYVVGAGLAFYQCTQRATYWPSLLVGGIGLFLAGRVICYQAWLRKQGGRLLGHSLPRLDLGIRCPRKFGAWMELLGISVALHSIAAALFAALLFPCFVWLANEGRERELLKANPKSGLDHLRRVRRALLPNGWVFFGVLVGPAVAASLTALLTRELVIFTGSKDTAVSLLISLAQIEMTVALLVITLVFALLEVATASYSTRTSFLLVRRRSFLFAGVAAAVTVLWCFWWAAGVEAMLPASGLSSHLVIDLAFLFSLAGFALLAFFVRDAFLAVSPEAMMEEALRGFDEEWLKTVRREWSHLHKPRSMYIHRDPMIPIERLLVGALNRRDVNSFRAGTIILREHLIHLMSEDDIVALDAYLASHLGGVATMAGRQSIPEALLALLDLSQLLGAPEPASVVAKLAVWMNPPGPGLQLAGQMVNAAMEGRLQEPAERGLALVQRRATEVLGVLPGVQDIYLLNPAREDVDMTGPQAKQFRDNDSRIRNFERAFIAYLGDKGTAAIDQGMSRTAWGRRSDYRS